MSRRRKPDIVFTEPVQHHESPRKRLYNSRRRKNVKRSFGTVALICGVISLLIFVFPLIDLPIGILGIIFAFVTFGIKTDGRDVGHHMATAGLFASIASIVLSGVFWFMSEKNKNANEKKLEKLNSQLVETLTGVWKSDANSNVSIEFTPAGNLIFAELASSSDDAEPLRETAGLYQVSETSMVIAFGSHSTKFTWEILPSSQLMLMAPSDRDIHLPFAGKWRKVKTLKMGVDYDSASEELRAYFHQLDEYTERKKVLIKTLVKYRREKDSYVQQLNRYDEQNKPRDDQWRVLGGQLKSVNEHLEMINDRIATIDQVIIRLQGVIRNEGRQQDIQRLGMSETELVDLLATSHELEDKLKIERELETLSDSEVEKLLDEAKNSEEDVAPVDQNK